MTRRGPSVHPSRLGAAWVRLRRGLAALVAVVIITTAVLVGIGRLLVPHADSMRPWLEAELSERLGRDVQIERIEARWPRLTPTITLFNVRAGGAGAPPAQIGRAILETHLPNLFRPDRSPFRMVVLDLDLLVAQDAAGRWGLRLERGGSIGQDRSGGLSGPSGELLLRDARLQVRPHDRPAVEMVLSEGIIRRSEEVTELLAELRLTTAGTAPFSFAARARHPGGSLREVVGRADLDDLVLSQTAFADFLPAAFELPPDRLTAGLRFGWRRTAGGWLDLDFSLRGDDGFRASGRLRAERQGRRIDARLASLDHGGEPVLQDVVIARDAGLWAVDLPQVDLAPLHRLAGRWLASWEHWPTRVAGRARALSALYRHPGSFHRLAGEIEDFTLDLPEDRVALSGLHASLGVSGDRARLDLSGSPVIDWPAKMRQPIPIESIAGRVLLSPRAVELDGIVGQRPEAQARADGWVWLGGGRPFLDFSIVGEVFEPVDPRPWLPAGQIPPRALTWLDRALLGVGSARGGLNYHFRLGHKFRSWNPGDFQARFDFSAADMDFWPAWPLARSMAGQVAFVGRGLTGSVNSGKLGALDVSAEDLRIPDLTRPELSLELAADAVDAESLRQLLADLPLESWPGFLAPLRGSGRLNLTTRLVLPFRDMPAWQLAGGAELDDTGIGVPAAGLAFDGLTGQVEFDRSGIAPAELQLGGGESGRIGIEAGFGDSTWLDLSGSLAPSAVVATDAPWRAIAQRLDGEAQWRVRLAGRESREGWRLDLSSNLQGLELTLPPPLDKSADSALELDLQGSGGPEGLSISARLGERLALEGGQRSGRWRLGLGLGRAAPRVPDEDAFSVVGSLDRRDIASWTAVVTAASVSASGDLQRRPRGWRAALMGDSVSGEITIPVPLDSGRVVAIDLEHLHLDEIIEGAAPDTLEDSPMAPQMRTSVPTAVPPLHLLIEELSYRGVTLGRMRVESHARVDGIEIERIEVVGPMLELSGYGRWIVGADGPVTEFEGRLASTDLEPLLQSFGYETGLSAARAQIELSGSWPGSPADFSLARLDGVLDLLMLDGNIPEARPGAGRLIGLVSISTVPRRLTLDFRDVFSEGLSFDRIEGRFELSAGLARTDSLRVNAPAADIELSGTTDLGARRYDQLVVVEPEVSNTLPVIGGLAGGPVGAAAGLILRSLLERPLQGIAEARYRISGSWDDPQVELIGTRAAEAPSGPSEPEPD